MEFTQQGYEVAATHEMQADHRDATEAGSSMLYCHTHIRPQFLKEHFQAFHSLPRNT